MMAARPTVEQERWLALARRYPALRAAIVEHGDTGGWQQVNLLTRVLLFWLGASAASLLWTLVPGIVTGLALIAAAEYLVRSRRMLGCGLDEALYAFGAAALTMEVLSLTSLPDPVSPLLAAVAAGLVGWRVLNAWFTAVGAVLLTGAVYLWFNVDRGYGEAALVACATAFVLGLAALAGCAREFRRPAHDAMCGTALLALVLATCVWGAVVRESSDVTVATAWVPHALVATLGAAALAVGLRLRLHPPLWAALLCGAALLAEGMRQAGWSWEWRLLVAGAVVLFFAILVERTLRRSRRGFTSRAIVADPAVLDLIQLGAAATLSPSPSSGPRQEDFAGGGGRHGGGGASGSF